MVNFRWLGRRLPCIAATGILFSALVAAGLYWSWTTDRARLRQVAHAATQGSTSDDERISRLTSWVYHNRGFEKNRHYFILKALEATPAQVLDHGGDCEDKSKLLVALLHEVDVPASMAIQYDCRETCRAAHVVVLARTSTGLATFDPVYDLSFPRPGGGFHTISALRSNPELLEKRLAELRHSRGENDKISLYNKEVENFNNVKTINLDKNIATIVIKNYLDRYEIDPTLINRPLIIDDSKEFLFYFSSFISIFLLAASVILKAIARKFTADLQP